MASLIRIILLVAVFLAAIPAASAGVGVNVTVAPATALNLQAARHADATWRVRAENTGSEPVSGRFHLVAGDGFAAHTHRTTVMPGTTARTFLSITAPRVNGTARIRFANKTHMLAAVRINASMAAATDITVTPVHAYPGRVRVKIVAPPHTETVAVTVQGGGNRRYVQRHIPLTNGVGYADVPYTPPLDDAPTITVSAATLDGRLAGTTTATVRRIPAWAAPLHRVVDLLEGIVVPRVRPVLDM